MPTNIMSKVKVNQHAVILQGLLHVITTMIMMMLKMNISFAIKVHSLMMIMTSSHVSIMRSKNQYFSKFIFLI